MAASAPSAPTARRNVVVFGASWPAADSELYALSVALGAGLAGAGYDVVSGGYGGTMAGVSQGARAGGGGAIGVLVPSLFPDHVAEGNAFLSSQVDAPTLLARIDAMLGLAQHPRLLIALPGGLGTLTEICAAWNIAAIEAAHGRRPCRLIAWRRPWEALLGAACEGLQLTAAQRELLVFVDSVEEAVQAVAAAVAAAAAAPAAAQ